MRDLLDDICDTATPWPVCLGLAAGIILGLMMIF